MGKHRFFVSLATLLAFNACAGGGDQLGNNSSNPTPTVRTFASNCGIVDDGSLQNPIAADEGVLGTITQVVSSNAFVMQLPEGPQLVKLHGIDEVTNEYRERTLATLNSIIGRSVLFVNAGKDCTATVAGGGLGRTGQLLDPEDGTSLSEAIIGAGISGTFSDGTCNEALVTSCYRALKSQVTPAPTAAGVVGDLLWKPEAESVFNPGKLVVHVDQCNVRVVANGQTLEEFGPGNGRCTTARSLSTSGCGFGSNIRLQVFDISSGLPYRFNNGQTTFIVPNGCARAGYGPNFRP